LKAPNSDDYDMRFITTGGGGQIHCPNAQSKSLGIVGGTAFDHSTIVEIMCRASQHGRNQLHLVGRYEGANDAFAATSARNAIMFKSQSGLDSAVTNQWTIQSFPNGTNNNFGFMEGSNDTPKVMCRGSNGNVGIGTVSPGYKLHVSVGNSSLSYDGPNSTWSSYLLTGSGTNKIGTRGDLAHV
jgi:hypothetical protein